MVPNPWTCFLATTNYRKEEFFLLQVAFAIEGKNQVSVNRTPVCAPRGLPDLRSPVSTKKQNAWLFDFAACKTRATRRGNGLTHPPPRKRGRKE
jgi:hypothetical protein